MTTSSRLYPNLYKDSVSLMTVSAKVTAVPGIDAASVVMASATNVENLAQAGPGRHSRSGPTISSSPWRAPTRPATEALELADELLLSKSRGRRRRRCHRQGRRHQHPDGRQPRTPTLNLALISVPGDYAAAEAMKALRLGMDVMLFSDNVPPEAELALKTYARERDLMVMGPDCGTAIVNGIPLGFANVVRRGPIGVVGASGTGTQEVTVRIHQLGSGVSQALGTGGHDLAEAIGGISMLHGLAALDGDPRHESHRAGVQAAARKPWRPRCLPRPRPAPSRWSSSSSAPIPLPITRDGVYGAAYLAQAADMAVALGRRRAAARAGDIAIARRDAAHAAASRPLRWRRRQRYVRGIFSGGTFCFEAQLIHRGQGITCILEHAGRRQHGARRHRPAAVEHTIIDMGDDEFTQGRPHPMIDPSLRDARIRDEIADPTTAVVLFDVVLGYGSADDPIAGLLGVIGSAEAKRAGRSVAFIGYVCGTDLDPQDRGAGRGRRWSPPACWSPRRNAEAAAWSAALISRAAGSRTHEDAVRAGSQGRQRRPAELRRQHRRGRRQATQLSLGAARRGGCRARLDAGQPDRRSAHRGGQPRSPTTATSRPSRAWSTSCWRRDAIPALGRASAASCTPGRRSPGRTCAARSRARSPARSSTRAGPTTLEAAERLAADGAVALEPCHHHGAVGPMAGIISPSMPVWVVENTAAGNRAFCNLNEGLGKVLRFGANSPEVLERLRWLGSEFFTDDAGRRARAGRRQTSSR